MVGISKLHDHSKELEMKQDKAQAERLGSDIATTVNYTINQICDKHSLFRLIAKVIGGQGSLSFGLMARAFKLCWPKVTRVLILL